MYCLFLKHCTNIHIFDTVIIYSITTVKRFLDEKQCPYESNQFFKVTNALKIGDEGSEEDEPNEFETEDREKGISSLKNDASVADRSIEKEVARN